jgi:hypothetical protein
VAPVPNNITVTKAYGGVLLDSLGDRVSVTKAYGGALLDSIADRVSVTKAYGGALLDSTNSVSVTKTYVGVVLADTDEEVEAPAAPVTGRGVGLAGRIGFTNVRFR